MQLKQKGSESAPLFYFVLLEPLLCALRTMVVCLVRMRMMPVSMVTMMFLGGGCGFRRFRLGR
jgi:hypothetical protein